MCRTSVIHRCAIMLRSRTACASGQDGTASSRGCGARTHNFNISRPPQLHGL
uniref:Uncharacterized protein n=1 Tax=Ciona intestinalis TaxID=7719 RepID=H2Y0I4_CIOIN